MLKRNLPDVQVSSFGYGHGDRVTPIGHITIDVRNLFRDPHVSPELRQLDGRDPAVIKAVLAQPGAQEFVHHLAAVVKNLVAQAQPVRVAIGCVGGRHRSVVLATMLALELQSQAGLLVELVHRDIERPVIVIQR
jgi:RNase adapter protein RapZ